MLCRGLLALLLLASTGSAWAASNSETLPIRSHQITSFAVGSSDTRFGALEFVGGLEMTSPNSLFGAVSAIRFRPDGTSFIAIMDTGHWLEGAVTRDVDGRLSGLMDLIATPMADRNGDVGLAKWKVDSEGLALRSGQVVVSYEQGHRIDIYPAPGFAASTPIGSLALPFPIKELRNNGGIETIAVAPRNSPLAGATIAVAERSVDKADNLLAGILDGPKRGAFSVVRKDPYAVTDGAFLPNGDLLLLERRFSFGSGLGMQIRRIAGDTIKPGAVVDGEVIFEADMRYQIDNMEGLDVVARPDGEVRVIVVSDDNHSILERNLMLEFRLTSPLTQ
ncbi:esterase-like activity of phytase family protein [Ensifer sesbaniae]|uniref:esterase-like activity of phytase family protein n=1 Tax=Ensifer sesbaniae TaxID=1214071 RepID=UPI002000D566|nr:esterase-like activity of phytase family protein [Ensifer sesbaniae]